MYFRTILSGTLAVLLLSGAALAAGNNGQSEKEGGFSFHLPSIGLPGVFGSKSNSENNTQVAQSDAGGVALQEQLRAMNGKLEELNFQILQMQEQMRKQQEDNEFRFQQIEGGGSGAPQKKSDAGTTDNSRMAAAPAVQPPAAAQQPVTTGTADAPPQPSGQSVEEVIIDSGDGEPGQVIKGNPSQTFGTITVDKNGNVVDAGAGDQSSAAPPAQAPAAAGNSNGTVVAALPSTNDPSELYRNSYQFILSGDYSTAEQGFRDHISRFPKDSRAADAHYWLGESLLGQQKYRDAAEVFLAASKDYPKAKKAPDMLLKLGVSLAGLKQRDVACATFGEIGKRYSDISGAMKERVKQERANASC